MGALTFKSHDHEHFHEIEGLVTESELREILSFAGGAQRCRYSDLEKIDKLVSYMQEVGSGFQSSRIQARYEVFVDSIAKLRTFINTYFDEVAADICQLDRWAKEVPDNHPRKPEYYQHVKQLSQLIDDVDRNHRNFRIRVKHVLAI